MINAYKVLVGKPETERPLGRPTYRWEYIIIIRIDLRETGYEYVDWLHLAQDRDQRRALLNRIINHRVP
jgi:hypothetical protein